MMGRTGLQRMIRVGAMCGRFTQSHTWHEICDHYGLTSAAHNLQAHYNIAPTDPVDVVKSGDGGASRRRSPSHVAGVQARQQDRQRR